MMLTELIEAPARWRKAIFDPEAHTLSSNRDHSTGGVGFFLHPSF
jgi:hypothetical protein